MSDATTDAINNDVLTDFIPVDGDGAEDAAETTADNKRPAGQFGTFTGVFLPTLLTIMGAIMYLRLGWVVGNAGLLGGLAIVGLANVITICTALSISSIATNIRVRAGGAFSIISQSLGLEVGGSVTVPFYLAQSISVAFYVFAFTEGWLRIFPEHPEGIVVFGVFAVMFSIVYVSARLASNTHFLILGIHFVSLTSIFLGSFGVASAKGMTETPQLWGEFEAGNLWVIFAVFFPAVTGVLAGVNMSGALKNPRRSIPIGTLGAVLTTMAIYMVLAFWLSRVATPAELRDNLTVMVDKAAFGPAVLAGLLAATFSAGLTSLVGAPRILQAIAQHNILPAGKKLSSTTAQGEPRPALFLTGVITMAGLAFGLLTGGLNAIAPMMTMFFLITYAVLNAVVLLEQSLGLVSFRPTFKVSIAIPFLGLVGCLFAMFLINPIFSLVAILVILGLYAYLSRRHLTAPWSDVRSGLFVTLAEWAAKRVIKMPTIQERAWKPNLLVPVTTADELLGSYRFLHALTYPRGSVHVLGLYKTGIKNRVEALRDIIDAFTNDGIFAQMALLEVDDYSRGLNISVDVLRSVFFRPNALFLKIDDNSDETTLRQMLNRVAENQTGAILYASHHQAGLGREQRINVWIREQSPDWEVRLRRSRLDLALLLAYQIARNWNGHINLITVVEDPAEVDNGREFLNNLITVGRMPRGTKAIVETGDFMEYLPRSPRADLQIFGTQQEISLNFIRHVVNIHHTSCIVVQDSGLESALA